MEPKGVILRHAFSATLQVFRASSRREAYRPRREDGTGDSPAHPTTQARHLDAAGRGNSERPKPDVSLGLSGLSG